MRKMIFFLEVYVWNEETKDWYVHHDYMIDAPPLALAPFNYDPGSPNLKGNLLAVGTMKPQISIWDLDIVNAIEPVMKLGKSSKSQRNGGRNRRAANQQSGVGKISHTDAVLSLDWNQNSQHILASGSADCSIILWDIEEAKGSKCFTNFEGMIQSIQWHPVEAAVLLAGTRAGTVSVSDCRVETTTSSKPPICWSFKGEEKVEVEQVIWDHFDPFYVLCCTDEGKLYYLDTRQPRDFVCELKAHDDGCNGVAQSFRIKGLLATAGSNEVKVWNLKQGNFSLLHTQPLKMGRVNVVRFCLDDKLGTVLGVGAESEEAVRLLHLSKYPTVSTAFFNQELRISQQL